MNESPKKYIKIVFGDGSERNYINLRRKCIHKKKIKRELKKMGLNELSQEEEQSMTVSVMSMMEEEGC